MTGQDYTGFPLVTTHMARAAKLEIRKSVLIAVVDDGQEQCLKHLQAFCIEQVRLTTFNS